MSTKKTTRAKNKTQRPISEFMKADRPRAGSSRADGQGGGGPSLSTENNITLTQPDQDWVDWSASPAPSPTPHAEPVQKRVHDNETDYVPHASESVCPTAVFPAIIPQVARNILPTQHVQKLKTNKRAFADVETSPDQILTKRQDLAVQSPPGHTDDSSINTSNIQQLDGQSSPPASPTVNKAAATAATSNRTTNRPPRYRPPRYGVDWWDS